MNSDHVPAMILLAKVHASLDSTEATMTAVDRLGFHLRLKTADGMKGTRINFLREVQNSDEARKVLVEKGSSRRAQSLTKANDRILIPSRIRQLVAVHFEPFDRLEKSRPRVTRAAMKALEKGSDHVRAASSSSWLTSLILPTPHKTV